MFEEHLFEMLIALAIGAMIGLEREIEIQQKRIKDTVGVRTFMLIALLGSLTALLVDFHQWMFAAAFIVLSLFILVHYLLAGLSERKREMTTEFTAILTFILAAVAIEGYAQFAVLFAILILVILTLKRPLHTFARNVLASELQAAIKFAVITLVVLPFLPNVDFAPTDSSAIASVSKAISPQFFTVLSQLDVFNPYKIWLMVVFISGLSFIGYILVKTVGAGKGIGITALLGGMVSSTAVTSSMALESKRVKGISLAAAVGVLIACSVMFVRVLVELLVVNPSLLSLAALPLFAMTLSGFLGAYYFYHKQRSKHKHKHEVSFSTPFALGPALKFALFFGFVLLLSKLGQLFFGSKGVLAASLVAGFADVDAITLSLANLAATGDISSTVAVTGIVLATMTNTAVKAGIAYLFGESLFSRRVVVALSTTVVIGILALLVF